MFGNTADALERERFIPSLPDRNDAFPNQLEAALKGSGLGKNSVGRGSVVVVVVFDALGGVRAV